MKLTRMQTAVLSLYARGLDHEQIAKRMERSPSAIYAHTKAVRDAWRLETYEQLRDRARDLGLDRLS